MLSEPYFKHSDTNWDKNIDAQNLKSGGGGGGGGCCAPSIPATVVAENILHKKIRGELEHFVLLPLKNSDAHR